MNFIYHDGVITIINNGEVKIYHEEDVVNYRDVLDALNNGCTFEEFEDLIDLKKILDKKSNGKFVLDQTNNTVTYDGRELHGSLKNRLIDLLRDGKDCKSLEKFLDNLYKNPSHTSVTELYDFLAHKNLPITDDGCFLAYKTVVVYRGTTTFTDVHGNVVKPGDYVDKYSGKVRNNIGDAPEMARVDVDDNCNRTCSHGYHVGALEYAGPGGWYNNVDDVVLIVKVNPKDAVSVPADHSAQKLRTCRYEVAAEFKSALNKSVYTEEDDLVYEEYDELANRASSATDVSDIRYEDELVFDYDSGDQVKQRHILVDTVSKDYIKGYLEKGDPSYNPDKMEYRAFLKDHMDNIRVMMD